MGYFKRLPDWLYTSRLKEKNSDYDFVQVKNFYRRAKVREDFFENFTSFEKYTILGDERPDQVADRFYGDPELDWVIMIVNNIQNLYTEWPLPQDSFEQFLLQKYGSIQNYNKVHHYETVEVKNSRGRIVLPAGIEVDEDFSISFLDGLNETIDQDVTVAITNQEYEIKNQNELREIYVLRPYFLQQFLNDVDEVFTYEKGGSQYVNDRLKRGSTDPR